MMIVRPRATPTIHFPRSSLLASVTLLLTTRAAFGIDTGFAEEDPAAGACDDAGLCPQDEPALEPARAAAV